MPGRYWHMQDDGRIQCDICPRYCKLNEGQRGLCFIRAREQDQMVLTSYGRSSGFCIDPIEKKPLNHFYPGTPVLSFGTAGCNLTCKFCQNHDMSKSREMDTLADAAPPAMLADRARRMDCVSMAYTYNDPVIFLEYAVDTAEACHALGIKNVAVTAGYICAEPRAEFYQHMDAANVDLKAFSEDFYRKITGSQLGAVKETLDYLVNQTDVWVEITTLLIPGENDSPAEIHEMTDWVRNKLGPDVPMHFTAFHPDFRMLDKERTPPDTLLRARRIALENGIRHVYVGNVHHEPAQSTYCSGCGAKVIGRDWHLLSEWRLTDISTCTYCDTPLPGRFDGPPGEWGRKRQRVRMTPPTSKAPAQQPPSLSS